jgi:hypothetical protein
MEHFARYRSIVEKIQQLAGNITALKQKEWEELNRLNEERARLNQIIISEVEAKARKLEDFMALLTAHTSGPDSTAEDILALEPVLINFQSLLDTAYPHMAPSLTGKESPSAAAGGDTEIAGEGLQSPQEDPRPGQHHCPALEAEAEAAAAMDPAPVKKKKPRRSPGKHFHREKPIKIIRRPINKHYPIKRNKRLKTTSP